MDDSSFSLIGNLVKAPLPDQSLAKGKVDFKSAMQSLGYSSVFDILRSSKKSFVRQIATLSDANAELAYDNARCYATQIVRLYRNELISSGRKPALTARTGVRSLVEIGPSFPNLFKENWDQFCKVGAIEAKDSPVAYLTSLYRFALRELEGTTTDAMRITLATRRPDLANLLLDQQTTFKPVPMLDIVKNVLESGIKAYTELDDNPDKGKTIHQLIGLKKHPFLFPFNYHHQQMQLGLSGKKPMLGEINYRISLKLPVYQPASNAYGAVKTSSAVAQCLMSDLSPEQQVIVTEPSVFDRDNEDDAYQNFYTSYYDSYVLPEGENPLVHLKAFLEQTELDADGFEALIAYGQHIPVKSPNTGAAPSSIPRAWAARYINKENASQDYSISLTYSKLTNTAHHSFDRMQRLIRLRRWTGLSFLELDTFISSAAGAELNNDETSANPDITLNTNTLRAFGLYRYLNKHYNITIDEASAIFYQLLTFSERDGSAQFDQVFNHPQLFSAPFTVGSSYIYVEPQTDTAQRLTSQLCSGLKITQTEDSLGILNFDITHFYNQPGSDTKDPSTALWSLSSYYRQVRIAQMFGLSIAESHGLIDLLGGEQYRHVVVRGKIEPVRDADTPPDLLDVLMQMDWAVKWLNETGQDVTTLRTRLGLDPSPTQTNQQWSDAIAQLTKDTYDTLLSAESLTELGLPSIAAEQTTIDWLLLLHDIVDEHGLVKTLPLTLEENSRAALRDKVSTALEPVLSGVSKDTITEQLTDFVLGKLMLQQRLIEGLVQQLSGLPMNRVMVVTRWAGTDTHSLLTEVLQASEAGLRFADSSETLTDAIGQVLRYGEVCQQLNLSAPALRFFLVNPGWLDPALTDPLLPLNLGSVYHLDRYARWVADSGVAEEQMLQYFVAANASDANKDQCAAMLATLISWPAIDIVTTAALLPGGIAKSMNAIDWLRRVKATCEQAGLGTKNLLKAAGLDPTAVVALDWQTVGEAVVTTSRSR